MIEFSIILTGCFLIIIWYLLKKIVHLRQDVEILVQLFQMKIVTQGAKDHPDQVDIIIGDDEDVEDYKSRQTQTTSEDK